MNLYVKYRPSTFDQIVGNQKVIGTLEGFLGDLDKCPSTFLLHGPTGCGKTTVARIMAKRLGCDGMDLHEINSANFRGIETVRELYRSSRFCSIEGGSRVWLIDEVHKMTNDAQTAILKILEEPPVNSYFILCTTEPSKLLSTIRGRCIDLQMNPLDEEEMFGLLRSIVKAEDQRIKKLVYSQIIQDSFGLPRNAIQILDSVLQVSPEKQLEVAEQSAEEYSQSIELCRALVAGDSWAKVRNILNGLKKQEPESIRRHILGYAQSVLLGGEKDRAALIIEELWEPLYNIGFPGLVFACYSVVKG